MCHGAFEAFEAFLPAEMPFEDSLTLLCLTFLKHDHVVLGREAPTVTFSRAGAPRIHENGASLGCVAKTDSSSSDSD